MSVWNVPNVEYKASPAACRDVSVKKIAVVFVPPIDLVSHSKLSANYVTSTIAKVDVSEANTTRGNLVDYTHS